jgi:hypothetical protein
METETHVNRSSVAIRKEGLTVRVVGDETLFLDTKGSSIHVADEVGSFIYGRIDDRKTVSAILEEIMAEYDIDEATAESDLYVFLGELVTKNILEIR